MLAAGVAARDGGLVNLSLVPDRVGPKGKKVLNLISTIVCVVYSIVLTVEGIGRMLVDQTESPILHIPKSWFWLFIVVGGISLTLHFIENCIDYQSGAFDEPELEDKADGKEAKA